MSLLPGVEAVSCGRMRYICVSIMNYTLSPIRYRILLVARLKTPMRKTAAATLGYVDSVQFGAAFIVFMILALKYSLKWFSSLKNPGGYAGSWVIREAEPEFRGIFPCSRRNAHGTNHRNVLRCFCMSS